MKKQITITEQKSRTIEVEIPSFHNFHGRYSAVTEHAVINVWSNRMVAFDPVGESDRYNKAVDDVLTYGSHVFCTKEEFDTAFNNTIKCLTEQYQLSMNMLHDPNAPQAANEEVKAVEATEQTTEQATEETGEQVAAE